MLALAFARAATRGSEWRGRESSRMRRARLLTALSPAVAAASASGRCRTGTFAGLRIFSSRTTRNRGPRSPCTSGTVRVSPFPMDPQPNIPVSFRKTQPAGKGQTARVDPNDATLREFSDEMVRPAPKSSLRVQYLWRGEPDAAKGTSASPQAQLRTQLSSSHPGGNGGDSDGGGTAIAALNAVEAPSTQRAAP